jgi:hypothetical protein
MTGLTVFTNPPKRKPPGWVMAGYPVSVGAYDGHIVSYHSDDDTVTVKFYDRPGDEYADVPRKKVKPRHPEPSGRVVRNPPKKRRSYVPPTRYTDEELARMAIADELQDARTSRRYARELRGGADPRHYGMTADQLEAYAEKLLAAARTKRGKPARNPPHVDVSDRVYEIRYRHSADGKDYKHVFKSGVCAQLLADGSVRLYHKSGKPLMREY